MDSMINRFKEKEEREREGKVIGPNSTPKASS